MERKAFRGVSLVVGAIGNITFDAHNRVDPGLLGQLVKLDCAVEVAVVGQGNGGLPQLHHPINHVAQSAETVEQ